ncbi:hypothetical protein BDQ17DRAFT_1546988 [Cyathus striatus]|nr:hypothetical protein BDQ17DRAFT_1546988 [Cyathus striatus]
MARFTPEAGAAFAFLIAYTFVFVGMLYAYITRRFKWRSWWSLLFFHVTLRLASQGSGIALGILGLTSRGAFLAYLNLGTEGYFTLILCVHRFLIRWHEHNLPSNKSWLEPPEDHLTKPQKLLKTLAFIALGPLALYFYDREPKTMLDIIVNLANTSLIIGGSYLTGADFNNLNSPDTIKRLNIAKITRTLGNSIFLACTLGILIVILATIIGDWSKRRRVHSTLVILLVTWIPLFIRGVFSVFQSALWRLSYYNPENHTSEGFSPGFTALENLLGILTEWIACVLLNLTYFTSKDDPPKPSKRTPPLGDPPISEAESIGLQHLSSNSS